MKLTFDQLPLGLWLMLLQAHSALRHGPHLAIWSEVSSNLGFVGF